jgi:GT2 family glycosyltransferase
LRERTPFSNHVVVCSRASSGDVNAAIRAQASDYVVVLDASVQPVDDGWLTALLEYAQHPSIGAVGGKIQYSDGRLRHIGLVLGAGGGVARAMHGHLHTDGFFPHSIGVANCSAVSSECLVTRRELFDEAGGFDEQLPWSVADVDYCAKVGRSGRRIVCTPFAAFRLEDDAKAASLPAPEALHALRQRWGTLLDRDPFYNPNFSRRNADRQLD